MTDTVAINYSRDAGWTGSVIAELCRGQPSTIQVTFNYDRRPEIGLYRGALSDDVFARLLAGVQGSGYQQLFKPGVHSPGTKFIVLGERQAGEAMPKLLSFELNDLPPAVSAVAQEIETVIAELRRNRTRVIEASAAWIKPVFDPNEVLALQVALRNIGTAPLSLSNPLGAPAGTWCGLRLFVSDQRGEEQCLELQASHLRGPRGGSAESSLALPPAASLSFVVRKKVFLSPGQYECAFSYRNVIAEQDNGDFVEGEISMAIAPLIVQQALRER
jgi:hypothetical protein